MPKKERLFINEPLQSFFKKICSEKRGFFSFNKLAKELFDYCLIKQKAKNNDELTRILAFYKGGKALPDQRTLKRAFEGEVPAGGHIFLVDLLSYWSADKNSVELQRDLVSEENQKSSSYSEPISILNKEIKRSTILHLNDNFWNKLYIPDLELRNKSLFRFYTHTDSTLTAKAVAQNNFIIQPDESFEVSNRDGDMDQLFIGQVVDIATAEQFSLIKILADGGFGKSTFLLWIAKKYCTVFDFILIKQITTETFLEIKIFLKKNQIDVKNQLILVVDNFASSENAKLLPTLIEDIQDEILNPCVFIIADRESRSNVNFTDDIDKYFGSNVQNIKYKSPNKAEIFQALWKQLINQNNLLEDVNIELQCSNIFLEDENTGISESTYRVLEYLNLKYKIDYKFDWDEWDIFIRSHNEYYSLLGLFALTACFFQFGIKVPTSIKSSFLGESNRFEIIDSISSFGENKSPIVIEDDASYLSLKNETIAQWYLKTHKGKKYADLFVKDFINEIDNITSAKLLRKLRKIVDTREYVNSAFGKILTKEKMLEIVDGYLVKHSLIEQEQEKMITEKGILQLQLGKYDEAIDTFKKGVSKFPTNPYIRNQLAKIYSRDVSTFQLAINQYAELENQGLYFATVEIHKILLKAKEAKVIIEYHENIDITRKLLIKETSKFARVIKEFINTKQISRAKEFLETDTMPVIVKAQLYKYIANRISLTKENIIEKDQLYAKALLLYRKSKQEIQDVTFYTEYAIFLYRIGDFKKSTNIIKSISGNKKEKDEIERLHEQSIKKITFIFYKDLPSSEHKNIYQTFLLKECQRVTPLINKRETNVKKIIQGLLILKTVYKLSRYSPDALTNCKLLLAYFYSSHSEKKITDLTPLDNRKIAEKLYDDLLDYQIELKRYYIINMLDNLVKINERKKFAKLITITDRLLVSKRIRCFSEVYSYRGLAKTHFETYDSAMEEYVVGLQYNKLEYFDSYFNYVTARCHLMLNIANLICETIERKRYLKGTTTIKNAIECYNEIKEYRASFYHLPLLRERINKIINKDIDNENVI